MLLGQSPLLRPWDGRRTQDEGTFVHSRSLKNCAASSFILNIGFEHLGTGIFNENN